MEQARILMEQASDALSRLVLLGRGERVCGIASLLEKCRGSEKSLYIQYIDICFT
jgi:hypothetical protein